MPHRERRRRSSELNFCKFDRHHSDAAVAREIIPDPLDATVRTRYFFLFATVILLVRGMGWEKKVGKFLGRLRFHGRVRYADAWVSKIETIRMYFGINTSDSKQNMKKRCSRENHSRYKWSTGLYSER